EWIEETSAAGSNLKQNSDIYDVRCLAVNEQTIELNGVDYIIEINNKKEKESFSHLSKDTDNIVQ
ncbi:hypothetical protein FWK35_00037765, partial [Aphis craccivora]